MSFTFLMPDIGEGVVEGEVISWLKKEGDRLKKDEPVLILMTDKATVELPTPHAGVLSKTYYKPGDIAKKGLPLFDVSLTGALEKPLASPVVRKQAQELGLSLQGLKGSGPDGRILKDDLRSPSTNEIPLTGIRKAMLKKMEESHAHIPSFSYFEHADATRLVHLREKMQKEASSNGVKLTFMPFFLKALSLTLLKFPLANCSLNSEKTMLMQHPMHNIGIAMKTSLGLIVPVLKGIENMSLFDLIYAYQALKEKAKNNTISPSDMKAATITLTNFGALSRGAEYATPIINYPEVAILGVAHIRNEPIVQNNTIRIAEILHCSWSFDHRIIDGEAASQISSSFVKLIENPASLL